MPVSVTSFFIKASPAIPFLLKDEDLRGGFRVVPNYEYLKPFGSAPEAIHPGARRTGMMVVTANDMHLHQLAADGLFEDRGVVGAASKIEQVDGAFNLSPDGTLSINESYLLPQDGKAGDSLRLGPDGNPMWQAMEVNPSVGVRSTLSFVAPNALEGGQSLDFPLQMGRSNCLIDVRLDVPEIMLEGFGDATRSETNPYTFKSRHDQLFDDGSSVLPSGTVRFNRRYAIVSNNETPVSETIYWRMTNTGNLPVKPTVTLTFTAIE